VFAATVGVSDEASNLASGARAHWPRMWRVLLPDDELAALEKLRKREREALEPSNSRPDRMPEHMQQKLRDLDLKVYHCLT